MAICIQFRRLEEVYPVASPTFVLTVRISKSTHATFHALAEESNESMTKILDCASELYKRQRFLEGLDADFAALQKNKAAWE